MRISRIAILTAALALTCPAGSEAAEQDEPDRDSVRAALLWSMVPGCGHFYLGEYRAGAAYLGSALSLCGAGIWLDARNDRLDRKDEVNTFWILALKDWELSLFTTYRDALKSGGLDLRREGVDDTPVKDLFKAPFTRKHLSNPLVIVAGALGAAAAVYDARHAEHSYSAVRDVGILGLDANQEWGMGLYGLDAFSLSLGAAVSEEAVWRGLLQNEFEKAYGERWGLWSTSALFGAAHIVDLNGNVEPGRIVLPTIAGLYLGHMFQASDHRLAPSTAAHFWYNFAAMVTAFSLDPDNNPLGVSVSFAF